MSKARNTIEEPEEAAEHHAEKAQQEQAVAEQAVWDSLFRRLVTTINPGNLVVPVPMKIAQWMKSLQEGRQRLAARALAATYFQIAYSNQLKGSIPAKLFAAWVWGTGNVPKHWRTQLAAMLPLVTGVSGNRKTGKRRLTLKFDRAEDAVVYAATRNFLGPMKEMVTGENLTFVRRYQTRSMPTPAQWRQLKTVLGYDDFRPERGEYTRKECLRIDFERKRKSLASAVTLSTLAKSKDITMLFMPAVLGHRNSCRSYGQVARSLAREHTRSSTVKNGRIAAYSGKEKLVCASLAKGVVYDVFAGNGRWKNRGYFASAWTTFHFLKAGQQAKLFELWAAAAKPLGLVVIGVDKENNQYDLAAMAQMVRMAPAKLWQLHIRIYSPQDWQTRWTAVFAMPLPDAYGPTDSAVTGPKAPIEPPGDLLEIAELVRQAGGIRQTCRKINCKLDHSSVAKYLRTGKGLSARKASALRRHLFGSRPRGGTEIAEEFRAICEKHPGNLGWALAYRRLLRWSVVPMVPGSRSGYVAIKPYQTTLPREAEITLWWDLNPDASIGLILGALSGVFAFDVDNAVAERELFKLIGTDPQCPIQRSGGCTKSEPFRKHYLYRYPANIHCGAKWEPVEKGLEFRGSHGLLILAPSRHKTWTSENPKKYAWSEPGHEIWSTKLKSLPESAIELIKAHGAGKSPMQLAAKKAKRIERPRERTTEIPRSSGMRFSMKTQEFIRGKAKVGQRNDRLFSAAQELRDRGLTLADAVRVLHPGGEKCGLDAGEIRSTVESVFSQKTRPRKAG
jgi:hypothetical protein